MSQPSSVEKTGDLIFSCRDELFVVQALNFAPSLIRRDPLFRAQSIAGVD